MIDPSKSAHRAAVVQPEDGASFWQPVPANGFSHIKLIAENTGCDGLSCGFQHVAPGSHIRAHAHADQIELQICFRGKGRVVVDGVNHPLEEGTICFLGPHVRHEIINGSNQEELVMLWVIAPPGLEDFFESIGRPRQSGEPAPAPFARPEDVAKVEDAMGFRSVDRKKP